MVRRRFSGVVSGLLWLLPVRLDPHAKENRNPSRPAGVSPAGVGREYADNRSLLARSHSLLEGSAAPVKAEKRLNRASPERLSRSLADHSCA